MMVKHHRHEEDQVEEVQVDQEVAKAGWVVVVPEVSPTALILVAEVMMIEVTHSSGEDLDLLVGRQIIIQNTNTHTKETKKKKQRLQIFCRGHSSVCMEFAVDVDFFNDIYGSLL